MELRVAVALPSLSYEHIFSNFSLAKTDMCLACQPNVCLRSACLVVGKVLIPQDLEIKNKEATLH